MLSLLNRNYKKNSVILSLLGRKYNKQCNVIIIRQKL